MENLSTAILILELLGLIAGVLLLDLAEYWRHRLMHTNRLWRTHLVHHSDQRLDWSTEFRFHPLEAAYSTLLIMAVVGLLGISPSSLAVFAMLALAMGLFQHANISLGSHDRVLATVIVTPDLHRVHHTTMPESYNRNFGAVFSWWDRCFGTFRSPQHELRFGSSDITPDQASGLRNLLSLPFTRRSAGRSEASRSLSH